MYTQRFTSNYKYKYNIVCHINRNNKCVRVSDVCVAMPVLCLLVGIEAHIRISCDDDYDDDGVLVHIFVEYVHVLNIYMVQ